MTEQGPNLRAAPTDPEAESTPEALKRLGRATRPREAVLTAIRSASPPFTVDEILQATNGVGRATVFRTIKRLQETNVLCRLQLEDGEIRYQLSGGNHHHHFICRTCGTVSDFSDPVLDAHILNRARQARFKLTGHTVELYGECEACFQAAVADHAG